MKTNRILALAGLAVAAASFSACVSVEDETPAAPTSTTVRSSTTTSGTAPVLAPTGVSSSTTTTTRGPVL